TQAGARLTPRPAHNRGGQDDDPRSHATARPGRGTGPEGRRGALDLPRLSRHRRGRALRAHCRLQRRTARMAHRTVLALSGHRQARQQEDRMMRSPEEQFRLDAGELARDVLSRLIYDEVKRGYRFDGVLGEIQAERRQMALRVLEHLGEDTGKLVERYYRSYREALTETGWAA